MLHSSGEIIGGKAETGRIVGSVGGRELLRCLGWVGARSRLCGEMPRLRWRGMRAWSSEPNRTIVRVDWGSRMIGLGFISYPLQ